MNNNFLKLLLFSTLFPLWNVSVAFAGASECQDLFGKPLIESVENTWFETEYVLSIKKILDNFSPPGTKPGAIVAAQTKAKPNYWYHWVRDGALTVESLLQAYERSSNQDERFTIMAHIKDYVDFSEGNQLTWTRGADGEPKFNVDGSAFNDDWGRPQNDGPAIRASTMMHYLKIRQAQGATSSEITRFYDGKIPTNSIIKRDLEYIAHHWQDPSYDIWEEVMGDHFYTRMVQRRALIEGSQLARSLGDVGAADFYLAQAKLIEASIIDFWDPAAGIFVVTKNRVKGIDYKNSNIDSQVLLAFLHGSLDDGFLSLSDPRVQSTIAKTIDAFKHEFFINVNPEIPGVAIGRYPEDLYGGSNFNAGNPWVLATLGVGELYYKMTRLAASNGQTANAARYKQLGDQFIARVQYHAHPDGSLNEQINRYTGFMTSVDDLTWNYAAILTSFHAAQDVASTLQQNVVRRSARKKSNKTAN